MKTKSFVQAPGGLKTWLAVAIGLVLFNGAGNVPAASVAESLEKGIYLEETKGELKSAVQIYQQIVNDPGVDRRILAQAQLRLGLCQLKLGNKPQAISALDRLTLDFPDKDKLLAIVEQQMPQVLDEIAQQIERNYIQEVDRGELIETAIRAIVGKLDAKGGFLRTNDMEFLGAAEMKQLNEHMDQKVAGIGVALKVEGGEVFVQTVLAGSPALAGGLRARDRIVAVDGVELGEISQITKVVNLLRGPIGTPVSVGIKRAGSEGVLEVELVRDTIKLPSVLADHRRPDDTWDFMLDEQRKIGYVRLTQIGKQSADEMRGALDDLQARGVKALVLDLRNNGGGLLDGAVAISDLFVESGRIVTVKGRKGETVYDAKPEDTFTGFPIALLVNRKTASAAEIVAACLQDHQRAIVIGERTFGQGIVRSLFHLKTTAGAMKLPVAAFYRPNGKPMNRFPDAKDTDEWGVSPDAEYELPLTEEELKQYEKERSERDTLNTEVNPRPPLHDRQLEKALEWVRAQLETK
jgi:carboxyl-terminal processing protease